MHLANNHESLATVVTIFSKLLNMLTSLLIAVFYAHLSSYIKRLEEFMNQHRMKQLDNSPEADDIQSGVAKHSDEDIKGPLEDSKAGSEPYKEIVIFSGFEKGLKERQQKRMMRIERGAPPMPLRFSDSVGRSFAFPFHLARTWMVSYQILHLEKTSLS